MLVGYTIEYSVLVVSGGGGDILAVTRFLVITLNEKAQKHNQRTRKLEAALLETLC